MSANYSNLPPETQELLAQRYGIKRRYGWKITAALLSLIGRGCCGALGTLQILRFV
jgi:hypothetical protein